MTPATVTSLFAHGDIEALMIIEPKNPRFELLKNGTVEKTVPATKAWRAEQKAIVTEAHALLAAGVGAQIDAALATCGLPLSADGATPTRKMIVADVEGHADGSRVVTLRGGPNRGARIMAVSRLRATLERHNFVVNDGSGDALIVVAFPVQATQA